LPGLFGEPRPSSQLIGCNRSAEHVILTRSAHLDPACSYTGGFEITQRNITLDCRGATIEDPEGNQAVGVLAHGGTNFAMANVSVRNCIIQGFFNNFRVTRDGIRDLEPGQETINSYSHIELRNSRILRSRGAGIVIDIFVSGITVRDVEVAESGGVGIALEGGSRSNRIVHSHIHDNGFGDVDPVNGIPFDVAGIRYRLLSTGREGISLDGSHNNRISQNRFENNSNGAITLYRNCGDMGPEGPNQSWLRRFGADNNRIRRNTFTNEVFGVWVGARMSQNQLLRNCIDAAYVSGPGFRIHQDFAKRNRILANKFVNVTFAVRVEDDNTRVDRNKIESDNPSHRGIMIGTRNRGPALGQPVRGTIMRGNRTNIYLNPSPYTWIFDMDDTLFSRNRSSGHEAELHQAVPPAFNLHLFIKQFRVAP